MAALLLFVISSLLFTAQICAAELFWPFWTYNSMKFQPPKLEIIRTDEAPSPGLLFLAPKDSQLKDILPGSGAAGTIYDQDGDLIWKGPDIQTSNLQVQTLFGKPVLTYWSGEKKDGYGYGAIHILDDTYKEIYTVTLKGNYVTPSGSTEDSYIDIHESKITERNTILVTSYNITHADTTQVGGHPENWVLESSFQEIEVATNKVLFSWSALDHPDKMPISAARGEFFEDPQTQELPSDIHHINSVHDAASGYIVSFRHTFSIVYINRDGSVQWNIDGETGGDFDLCQTCKFSWQHHVTPFDETPDGLTLAVFNNDGRQGPDKGRPTTGLVLDVDLVTMTVTNKRTLDHPGERINSDTQGSIHAIDGTADGNILMGYGSWATIREFNSKDEIIWTAKFGPDAEIGSYRSFKFDWHATPWYPPNVDVTAYQSPTSRMSTHFYVSWNGATDVAKWNFYAQASARSDPVLVGTVPKTGFETAFITEGYLDRVSVQAVLVNGTTLPRSPIIRTRLHGSNGESGWNMPQPDDPADIVGIAPNTAPDTVTEDVEVKYTLVPDPKVSSISEYGYLELKKPSPLPSDAGNSSGLICCKSFTMFETQPWVEAAPPFFIVCSLASSAILMLIWLRQRRKKKLRSAV